MSLLATVLQVAALLDQARIEFVIGGSLASSTWGQERTTHDADIAALISQAQFSALESLVSWPFVMDSEDIRASLPPTRDFASGQILHGETLDKIDLFLLQDDEYSRCLLDRRRFIKVTADRALPFSSPEDIVIAKLRWFVLGNQVSDRQWNDIVQVLETQQGNLDEGYLNDWSSRFGVRELLDRARTQVLPADQN